MTFNPFSARSYAQKANRAKSKSTGFGNTPLELQEAVKPEYWVNWEVIGDNLTYHIDYLKFRATIPEKQLKYFIRDCNHFQSEYLLEDGLDIGENAFLKYQKRILFLQGGKILIGNYIDKATGEVFDDMFNVVFEMSGEYCSYMSLKESLYFIRCIHAMYKPRWLRIDEAIDDWNKDLDLDIILDALESENYKGFIDCDLRKSFGKRKRSCRTIYLGSRRSPIYTRIYETHGKHKEIDTIRVERESKNNECQARVEALMYLFDESCGNSEKDAILINKIAIGAAKSLFKKVNFIDRDSNKNLSRCKLLNWWQEWLSKISEPIASMQYKRIHPEPTMAKKEKWLIRQVTKSLVMRKEYLGSGKFWKNLENEMKKAYENLTVSDWKIIENGRRLRQFMDLGQHETIGW